MMFCGFTICGALLLAAAALQSNAEEDLCTFCPFGYQVQNPDAFVNETTRPGLTCSDLSDEMVVSTTDQSDLCPVYRLPYWFEYPNACGYCEVPSEDVSEVCTICSDGSSPTADASTEIIPGFSTTCGQLSYIMINLEAGTSNCTDLQATTAPGCGCPYEAIENPCELCPGGLEDPTLFFDDSGMTCSDLVTYASTFPSDSEMCAGGQFLAFTDCGCPPPKPTQTRASFALAAPKTRRYFPTTPI